MTDVSQGFCAPSTVGAIADRTFARPPSGGDGLVRELGRPLPPELEFLAQHGVSLSLLLRAVAAAPRGIEPLDVLLGEGVVAEEHYHALAQHLGCAYFVGDPPFAGHFDAVKGLRCGVAPLAPRGEGPRAVIAPRAQLVPRLIKESRVGLIRRASPSLPPSDSPPLSGCGAERRSSPTRFSAFPTAFPRSAR